MNLPPPYHSRRLDASDFRLLRTDYSDNGVRYSLEHCEMAKAPPFYALSHAWGSGEASDYVECDDHHLAVTSRLLSGLKTLGQEFPTAQFWIDAININQDDETEKSIQVPLMAKIYSTAEKIVVWLGPSAEKSDMLMRSQHDLNRTLSGLEQVEIVEKLTLVDLGLPPFEHPVWLAAFRLCEREYFSRLWVIQEAVLAKSITVLCGECQVDFEDLFAFWDCLFTKSGGLLFDTVREYLINVLTTNILV